jgi:hypothetical protein
MSSNRLIYDDCAYAKKVQESTTPLQYNLYTGQFENCYNCPSDSKSNGTKISNILPFGHRADVESELNNQTRFASLCPSKKYNPCKSFQGYQYTPPEVCKGIYHITPNNLPKWPCVNKGFDETGLGRLSCKN